MKAARARLLAVRYPQAAEVLELVAGAYDVIGASRPDFAESGRLALRLFRELRERCPEAMRESPPDTGAYFQSPDPFAPSSFFSRLALEAWASAANLQIPDAAPNECPRCGHAPQLGVLRPSGNGDALYLACSLCRQEWPFRRTTCAECGETDPEKIQFHSPASIPHVQTQSCDSCRAYLHLLMPERELGLIPDIDELALLPLDVWAAERGLHKVWPNLAGI
ncbi:MAG TPA: formate dehydrogenase accessory protein FdhE [Bryobacteraceae bacterium]|nr:formate dehydrogenase accessory protein FdhE [Bryobacteraceae bacterium]